MDSYFILLLHEYKVLPEKAPERKYLAICMHRHCEYCQTKLQVS